MKILGYCWKTQSNGSFGVVLMQSHLVKAYIAMVKGENEQEDLKFICDHGAKIDIEFAISLIYRTGTVLEKFENIKYNSGQRLLVRKKDNSAFTLANKEYTDAVVEVISHNDEELECKLINGPSFIYCLVNELFEYYPLQTE